MNDVGLNTSWSSEDGKQVITMREVLTYLDETSVPVKDVDVSKLKSIIIPPADSKRTEEASLEYPIIVIINLEGKYQSVLDGNHRLQKGIDKGLQTMQVRELDLRTAPDLYKQLLNYKIAKEDVTTDSAGIGAQGGYNDGDTRLPWVMPVTFRRFYNDNMLSNNCCKGCADDVKKKKKKRCGKQIKNKRQRVRKGNSKTSFVDF